MNNLLLTLVFLSLTTVCLGQSVDNRTYKKAKIYLDNHRILKVNNLDVNDGTITFLNSTNKKQEEIALDNVKLIRIPKGSYVLEGALYGAGTLALTALLIDVQPDPLGIERERGAGFYLGLTAGGAAVGVLVGSIFPKWKEVYSGGKFISLNLPMTIDFSTQNKQFNIKIALSI